MYHQLATELHLFKVNNDGYLWYNEDNMNIVCLQLG